MQLEETRDTLLSVLDKKAPDHNAEIVDVWVMRQGNTPLIQVFVDRQRQEEFGNEGVEESVQVSPSEDASATQADHETDKARPNPISLDEVAEHTTWISQILDEIDPFEGAYNLEVSSPGIARPLRKLQDFIDYLGSTIKLKKKGTKGRLKYTGELSDIQDDCLIVVCDKKEEHIPLKDIERATVEPQY